MMRERVEKIIEANAEQKKVGKESKPMPVAVSAEKAADLPEKITRLGREKAEFLVNGIGQLKRGTKTLELFGGSNLSTAVIAEAVGEKNLVSLDLHYASSGRAPWQYEVKKNYTEAARGLGLKENAVAMVASDASRLPFAKETFEAVVAPDPPRVLAEKRAEAPVATAEFENLFARSAAEALRVLVPGGIFIGTSPLSMAEKIKTLGYAAVQIFSSEDLGEDVKRLRVGKRLSFKTEGVEDPVVYFRCVK